MVKAHCLVNDLPRSLLLNLCVCGTAVKGFKVESQILIDDIADGQRREIKGD